jgi:hypothetical protein
MDVAVTKCRRHAAAALVAAVVCALAFAAPAGAGSITSIDANYGDFGNAFPGIGPGSYSPEIVGFGGTYFGGVDATGAALANLDGVGSGPAAFLPTGRRDLAPASVGPSVPVFDVNTLPTTHYAAGSRAAAAAAWSEQPTPGVVRVRILDPTTGGAEAPFADQNIAVNVGGNAPPVPVAMRYNAARDAVLVAVSVVNVSGGVTSRAWAVAKVNLGTLDPAVPGQPTLDATYGTAGIARGPFTSGGGALQAMTRRGTNGAVLTGTGDFTGTDSVSTRLHVLVLNNAGQPDPTFGTAGLATIDATGDPDGPFGVPPAPQGGDDIVLGATGDITIAGGQGASGPSFVVRLSPAGNQRLSFGTGGHVLVVGWPEFDEVALYPDGSAYALAGGVGGSLLMHLGPSGDELAEVIFAPDSLQCADNPHAMTLSSFTNGDEIIIAGECGFGGLNAFNFTDSTRLRRVLASAAPAQINAGGRSVALAEAARPDPDSAAQSEVGGTIAATPLKQTPLKQTPLKQTPLKQTPLKQTPLKQTPLTEVSLRSPASWTAALKGTALAGKPLQTITFGQVLDLFGDTGIPGVTLGDLDTTKGILRRASVASLMLLGRPLDALPDPGFGWCQYLVSLGPLAPKCGQAGVEPAVTHTFDLELRGADLRAYWHGVPIPLTADVMGSGALAAPLGEVRLNAVNLAATPLGKLRQIDVNDAIGCTSSCETTLAAKQAANPAAFADVALGDLLASARAPAPGGLGQLFTLQEILPGIAPPEDFSPEEAAALDALLHRATTNSNRLALGTSFVVFCSETEPLQSGQEGLTIAIDAPGVGYTPGSGSFTIDGVTYDLVDPVVNGDRLTFTRMRDGGVEKPLSDACTTLSGAVFASISFDGEVPTALGSGSLTSTVTTGSGLQATSQTAHYEVVDNSDPPGDASTTVVLDPDTLYTGYIPNAGDVDAYRVHAPPAGSVVTISLSNLPADFDLFVQGPKAGIPVPPSRQRAQAAAVTADPPLADQSADLNADDKTPSPDSVTGMPMSATSLASLPLRGISNRSGTTNESVSGWRTAVVLASPGGSLLSTTS